MWLSVVACVYEEDTNNKSKSSAFEKWKGRRTTISLS